MDDATYKLYTDAGSRGNPGRSAASGILLNAHDKLVDIDGVYLGITTNNIAEYEGLILGLKLAIKNSCRRLSVYMDSQLVVRQVNGEYKIKDNNLYMRYLAVTELKKNFDSVTIGHVLRNKNAYADKLVNIILDNTK